jgi:hypothetical protein
MHPIPGNIICVGVMHIARHWLREICRGRAIRRLGEEAFPRPESAYIVSPVVMPQQRGDGRTGKPSTMRWSRRHSRPGECLVRGKDKRYCAERRDKRPIHSIRHGTHQFAGYGAAFQGTVGPASGARKYIINYWLRRNLNGHTPMALPLADHDTPL